MLFKDFLLVGLGSFVGGGMRFLVSKALQTCVASPFPLGTFTVNVLGCLLIGIVSGIPSTVGWLSPSTRLILTTGFCGGFTTFSTFMNENASLLKDDHLPYLALYLVGSMALGFLAVLVGHWIGKALG